MEVDLQDKQVLANVIGSGLMMGADDEVQLTVKQVFGTGYVWQHLVTPAGCVEIEVHSGEEDRVVGGASHLTYDLANAKDNCVLSMALARPWIWKGFSETDGQIIDPASAYESFVLTINSEVPK